MKGPIRQKTQFSLIYVLIAARPVRAPELAAGSADRRGPHEPLPARARGKGERVSLTDKGEIRALSPGALPAAAPRPATARTFLGAEPTVAIFTTTRIPGVDDSTLLKRFR